MEASARTIPFSWNDDLIHLFDRFFYEYDEWPVSRAAVNRRIDRVAGSSKLITDTDDLYPHSLRGRAATNFAREGLTAINLKKIMGWENIDAALTYVELAANDLETELRRISGSPY